MRQAGILAAAGIYALQNNIDRLSEDHRHAKQIAASACNKKICGSYVLPVETNIIIFELKNGIHVRRNGKVARTKRDLKPYITPQRVRLVTHLDINFRNG